MRRIALLLLMVLFATSASSLAGTIRVPDSVGTVTGALALASGGDTIWVSDGLYAENFYIGQNVVLLAESRQAILEGNQAASVITVNASCVVTGFTIQNGSDVVGGGIQIVGGGPLIEGNMIRNNQATSWGGGIYAAGAGYRIESNTITGNSALNGAGIFATGNPLEIKDNVIRGNVADTAGGGLVLMGGASVHGNIFDNNSAWNGGGLSSQGFSNRIEHNLFIDNTALHGAGVYTLAADSVIDNRFERNHAMTDPAWGDSAVGGGLFAYAFFVDPFLSNNLFVNNMSDSIGGGVALTGNSANGTMTIVNSNFTDNSAVFEGGAIHRSVANIILSSCTLTGNSAPMGPQIFNFGLLAAQQVISVTYCNVEGGWFGTGNIDVAPLFRNPAAGDFHLQSTACGDAFDSPLIDAGDPARSDSLLDCAHGLGAVRADMGVYGGSAQGVPTAASDDGPRAIYPRSLTLHPNYPNPFNPSTLIAFDIQVAAHVRLAVYNALGQQVKTWLNDIRQPGAYRIRWEGTDRFGHPVASGVYFCRLQSGDEITTRSMLLLR